MSKAERNFKMLEEIFATKPKDSQVDYRKKEMEASFSFTIF